jgi:hypothetical protein
MSANQLGMKKIGPVSGMRRVITLYAAVCKRNTFWLDGSLCPSVQMHRSAPWAEFEPIQT